jgi:hypothetical protein
LDTSKFQAYLVEANEYVKDSVFHRPRKLEVYKAPLALIHRSACEAAFFVTGFVAYRATITGVASKDGKSDGLKWLAAYIKPILIHH